MEKTYVNSNNFTLIDLNSLTKFKYMKKELNYTSGKRLEMISQGAYDGRFKNKVVKDKKKESNKNWARQK